MISNTADREMIEKEFGATFKFPKIYSPQPIIDQNIESILPIITNRYDNEINYGIWGLLPTNYIDSWESFQLLFPTLYISNTTLDKNEMALCAFHERRCLVIITGYILYHLFDGKLYPYYVSKKNKKPFSVAGVYNNTNDGFKTVAIITKAAISTFFKLQNINAFIPAALDKHQEKDWLENGFYEETKNAMLTAKEELEIYPLHRNFNASEIPVDKKLNPTFYKEIPLSIL